MRAFLSLAVGADAETSLEAAMGSPEALERVRSLATGKRLLDPFAGSGLIPIEASRLGMEAVGQDVNPYAVALAKSASDLCTGACRARDECLWRAAMRAWRRIRGFWCRGDACITHILLAKCPPCTAPRWVSSRRGGAAPRMLLVLTAEGSLEWVPPDSAGDLEATVELPGGLPWESEGYAAYAVEVYSRGGGRSWVSLLERTGEALEWRRFLEETGRVAWKLSESLGGVPIPLMEETRRLHRQRRVRSDTLYAWRQNVTYHEFLKEAAGCRVEAALSSATASPSTSLLAIYYQPLAKVNPGMVVKSYWLPKNPVVLNPLSHSEMPGDLHRGVRPVGRGTLVSVIEAYASACGRVDCGSPPSFMEGDSRLGAPGRDYDIVATDPPYPGLQTYRDLTIFYAHMMHLAGEVVGLDWEEIDTRDYGGYTRGVVLSLRRALSKSKPGAVLVLFISSHTGEGLAAAAEVVAEVARRGVGLMGVYPIYAEARGALGRALSKLVFTVVGVKGSPPKSDALTPLEWTREVADEIGLRGAEREYSVRLAQVFKGMLELKMGVYPP